MSCDHETFKCTNGVFSCLKCGAVIPNPYDAKETNEEPAQEAPKKPVKRKTKKEGLQ